MKSKDLILLLENLSPEAEIVVEVSDIITGNHLAEIYDISYDLTKRGELKLQISIEAKY